MMESIKMTRNMERVFSHGQVEIYTKEIMLRMSAMVMDKCFGQMAACMRENGKKEFSMVQDEWSLLMAQVKKDILKIIFSNIQHNKIIYKKISKLITNQAKKMFKNKQCKFK